MRTLKTPRGARLVEHGTVLSEVLRHPGPTHSVVDVLAAVVVLLSPGQPVALLGFAGGGIVGPLRALSSQHVLQAVDLYEDGYRLFCRLCGSWGGRVHFRRDDAVSWLQSTQKVFPMIIEDLSISDGSDVIKPLCVWETLPRLIRRRLEPEGVAVFDLLRPADRSWSEGLNAVLGPFRQGLVIEFIDFENRIVIAGRRLTGARDFSRGMRSLLRGLGSRLGDRISIRTVKG